MRYFIDCDDTLVLYKDDGEAHPYGIYDGVAYEFNWPLVDGIRELLDDDPLADIVIWSGGGRQYAEMWGEKLGFTSQVAFLTKDRTTFGLIREGDIVIDDQPLGGHRTHAPHDWPEQEVEEMTIQRPSWYEYHMGEAKQASTRASCPRASVGAVLVNSDNHMLFSGYNGALPDEPHCIDVGCFMDEHMEHCIRVVHAEANLIAQAAKTRGGAGGCDVYIWCNKHIENSCRNCYQLMKAAGVRNIYVRSEAGDTQDTTWKTG